MEAAKLNSAAPATQKVALSPPQLCVLLILEAQAQQLQIAANQLGGYMGLPEPADALLAAMNSLNQFKMKYLQAAAGSIVVAQPSDVPKLKGVK